MKFVTLISGLIGDQELQKKSHLLQIALRKEGWIVTSIGVPYKDSNGSNTIPMVFENPKKIIIEAEIAELKKAAQIAENIKLEGKYGPYMIGYTVFFLNYFMICLFGRKKI